MRRILVLCSIIFMVLLIAGCQSPAEPTPAAYQMSDAVSSSTESASDEPQTAATEITEDPTPETSPTETPTEIAAITPEPADECLECHQDKQRLIDTVKPEEEQVSESSGEGRGGEVAPLEPWEKVLVDGEMYSGTTHALTGCSDCHGGKQSSDKEDAHTEMILDPSEDAGAICGQCHPDILEHHDISLHNNLAGYWTELDQRSVPNDHPALEEAFDNHCASCHATCGDCHVSQPNLLGGGFISGHVFNRTPSMTRNCTACHGSRVGDEFLGKHEGLLADVHFRQGRMNCIDCHSGAEMHGEQADCQSCHPGPEGSELPPPDHRYTGVQSPSCESCHTVVSTGQDDILMHEMHGSKLSCQVCHSIAYTSCDGCHVAISDQTGNPFFETENSYQAFLIGKNPLNSFERPYEYVPVRHVPVAESSFDFYGDDLLKNFSALETWKYATPHNIQRNTPQTESCTMCHGSPEYFLTSDKVRPEELEANRAVIIDEIPADITEYFR